MPGSEPPLHARGVRVGHELTCVVVRAGWSLEVRGRAHVPATGPVLLAGNHTSALDGFLLQAASPRPVHCLAKRELFHGPLGWALRTTGQIAVDRGGADRAGLAAALEVLRAGGALGVFPEGTRASGGTFTTLRAGLAWFAARSGAPVVPVVCMGVGVRGRTLGGLPRPRTRLQVVIGAPLTVDLGGATGRARLQAAMAQVQQHLQAHLATVVAATDA